MAKFYLTTPIYYVNAKPHIGSAYTTIAADVLARYRRQRGDEVFFLTGTAEHGTKMAHAAAAAGKSPQEFVDENSAHFVAAWQHLGISHDDFIRTTEPRHTAAVVAFFARLKTSGMVYEAPYEGLYCVGHEAFITASSLDEHGLCLEHQKAPERIKETNWFFKLSAYAEVLREKISSNELLIEPASRKNEVLSFIDHGLDDISISRQNVEWAIALPWDPTQTIYVWLDELFNYCSAIGYGEQTEVFKKWWPADLHLVGKDIIKFHCIIWPALLLAIGEAIPKRVFAHGFFTVDGQKMSKTLGNVVDPVELVQDYGADAVRYCLLRDIPFGQDGDFSHQRLLERYNADLANGLGNLVSRTLTMIERFAPDLEPGTVVPVPVAAALAQVEPALGELAFDRALAAIWEAIAWADRAIEQHRPWELAKRGETEELRRILAELVATVQAVTGALEPFMPATYAQLTELLAQRPLVKPAQPLFQRRDEA